VNIAFIYLRHLRPCWHWVTTDGYLFRGWKGTRWWAKLADGRPPWRRWDGGLFLLPNFVLIVYFLYVVVCGVGGELRFFRPSTLRGRINEVLSLLLQQHRWYRKDVLSSLASAKFTAESRKALSQ